MAILEGELGFRPAAEPSTDAAPADPLGSGPALASLDLNIKLSDERLKRFSAFAVAEIRAYYQAVRSRLDNCRQWRRDLELVPPGKGNRWQGCADVPSPLARIAFASHLTRLNMQIITPTPPFYAKARTRAALEMAPAAEEAAAALVEEARWSEIADETHAELAAVGNVFFLTEHATETAQIPRRTVEQNEADYAALLDLGMEPSEAMARSVEDVGFEHEEQVTFDGVRYKLINFEDGIIIPPTVRRPEQAYAIGERFRVYGADLKQGVREGRYRKAAVARLLKQSGDPEPEDREERWDDQGLTEFVGGDGWDDDDYKEFTLHRMNWKGDWNGDGKQEWAILTIDVEHGEVLSLQYDDYEHGQSRYTMGRYITRPNELFGMGIPELVACFTDADTAVLCQLIDHQDLSINFGGNFWYTQQAGFDPEKQPLSMGMPIKVEDLDGIKEMQPLPMPSEAYALRDQIKTAVELVSASSNPALGRTTDADKTLGEVRIAVSSANMIFEDYAARVSRSFWSRIWDQTRWLVAQFGPQNLLGEIEYRKSAAPDRQEFAGITPQMLKAEIDLVPAGLEQLSDLQTRIQQAVLLMTEAKTNPLLAMNTEAQVLILEYWMKTLRLQPGPQIIASVHRQIQAQMAVQVAEMQAEAEMAGGLPAAGAAPGGVEPSPPSPPPGAAAPGPESGMGPPPGLNGGAPMGEPALAGGLVQ